MSSGSSFEEHLAREIIRSERVRMAVLAGLLGALIVFLGAMYALFQEDYGRHFATPRAIRRILVVLVVLLCYELTVRAVIGRRLRQGKSVPHALRYLNAFVETSVPSILILLVARETNPVHVLQSAAALLYGVFIVLSTLRLDFRLSAFTGVVAAVEYVALSHYYVGAGGEAFAGTPFDSAPFYLSKGAMLLLAGLAAGFAAQQLKRRVDNAFRAQEERHRIVSTFGQQVSPQIVDELLKRGTGGESRRAFVCVLFMDIRNFTPMVEHKTPEEITAFQNAVFGEAIEIVDRHHGIINQFLGDGFMATFGAPLATGDDCRNALAAAKALVARVGELSASGRIPSTRIGVGVHAGEAVTGNVGSALRKQYSITGHVVILASRIEQLNKQYDSQILASGEVLRAGGDEARGAVALGPVQLRGRNEPIELYRLA
jgi:adenylate cyclase